MCGPSCPDYGRRPSSRLAIFLLVLKHPRTGEVLSNFFTYGVLFVLLLSRTCPSGVGAPRRCGSTFKVIDFFSFCDHLTVTNGFPTSLCSHSQRVRTRLHQRCLLHRGLLHREGCTVPLLHSTCTLALLRSTRGPLGALRSSLGQGTRLALLHRPGSTVALFRRPGGRLSLVRRRVALLSRSRVTLCGTSGLIHTLLTRGSRRYLARPFTCLCVGLS